VTSDLVKVAYASDEAEAELLQGLLRLSAVDSVVRRAPGFDAPEFGAAGPREVLVAASDVPAARDILREVDSGEPPPPPSVADRRPWVRAGLLFGVALVVLVICVVTDVFP
jgi:Putative prokaryotic signal transducing protein